MKVINEKISIEELKKIAELTFGELVKAVVDIELGIMAVGGELHSDEEAILLSWGSKQENLWGINLYPNKYPQESWIEFEALINFKPFLGNMSCRIESFLVRTRILEIINNLVS